jgi:hypothetical protein
MHFAGATWLAFTVGGPGLVALYVAGLAIPGALIKNVNRAGGFLAPGALALLAFYWTGASAPMVAALGLVAGVGGAAARRPSAWTAGLNSTQGLAGVAGGVTAVILATSGGARYSLAVAALLLLLGWMAGERHELGGPLSPPVVPAAMGVGFAAGVRVLEPGFLKDEVSAAVFVAAWAMGSHLGWRASGRADARAVIAAPFAAAATLAVFGVMDGPAMPLLYGTIAGCVGLVGGTSEGSPPTGLWSDRRVAMLVAAISGAAWSFWMTESVETLMLGAAAVSLAGGFSSLTLARRMWVAEARGTTTEEVAPARPAPPTAARIVTETEQDEGVPGEPELAPVPAAPSVLEIARAVSELRSALTTAKAVRADAIAKVTRPPVSADEIRKSREAAVEALDEMIAEARSSLSKIA